MENILDGNPSMSEIIGPFGGDEKTECPRGNDSVKC